MFQIVISYPLIRSECWKKIISKFLNEGRKETLLCFVLFVTVEIVFDCKDNLMLNVVSIIDKLGRREKFFKNLLKKCNNTLKYQKNLWIFHNVTDPLPIVLRKKPPMTQFPVFFSRAHLCLRGHWAKTRAKAET